MNGSIRLLSDLARRVGHFNNLTKRLSGKLACLAIAPMLLMLTLPVKADIGVMEIKPNAALDGPVTVFYPSSTTALAIQRQGVELPLAWQGEPTRGNGRLVVVSHGSGASPWVHAGIAMALVRSGFIVAMPEHRADNYQDSSAAGPTSWKHRPTEVSKAIDVIASDARLAPLLTLDKVGVFGMSAGGHTALTLAGGRWSPAQYLRHCEAHITDDFQTCAGITFLLTGGMLDSLKQRLVLWYSRWSLNDETWYGHTDSRVGAIVVGVPFAADFDFASLANPIVPLGLITVGQDRWLQTQFHSDKVLRACLPRCEHLVDIADGSHGALISPLMQRSSGVLSSLVSDPPEFNRAQQIPRWENLVTSFFLKRLLRNQD